MKLAPTPPVTQLDLDIERMASEAEATTKEVIPSVFLSPRRDGSHALYEHGCGPFFSNRAARRSFTGTEGRHDASKVPTKGRVKREGWRGVTRPKPKPKPRPRPTPRPY